MTTLRKKIWRIYGLILLVGMLWMGHITFSSKAKLEDDYASVAIQSVNVVSNSLHVLLATQEGMLGLLGDELLEQEKSERFVETPHIFNSFLGRDTSIAALGLLNPRGDYLYISSNADVSKLPNLLEQPESEKSFKHTLQHEGMLLGRSYYFEPIGKKILPLRMALRNTDNHVVAIVAAALDLSVASEYFGALSNRASQSIQIVRGTDSYVQYGSPAEQFASPSQKPAYLDINQFSDSIRDRYGKSMQQMKRSGESFIIKGFVTEKNKIKFGAARYDEAFDIWTLSTSDYSIVRIDWIKNLVIHYILFIVAMAALATAFRAISLSGEKVRHSLMKQALSDYLTGLPNRNYLQSKAEEWISDETEPFSLLYIDMDNFKNVNDSYGHVFGDQVLKEISRRILAGLERSSTLIRHGGDEFLILSRVTEESILVEESDELIRSLSRPYSVNGQHFILGASIGIAKYPEHATDLESLVRAADIAMYEAKKQKNTTTLYLPGMEERKLRDIRIEQELRSALKYDELFMVYQPQLDHSGRVCGVEALIRWQNEKLGFVPPDQFIEVAENTGQMAGIGNFIIDSVLTDISAVNREGLLCPSISINISIQQFMQPGFIAALFERIDKEKSGLKIILEITESLFIEDIDYLLPILEEIHHRGIYISLDDFGTGYSSLGVIRKLPLDELKIDKSFVDDILTDKGAQQMIKNIIAIGKSQNLVVLAEGVETLEQKAMLDSFGCDRYQGYYFSKPLRKEELLEYLAQPAHLSYIS